MKAKTLTQLRENAKLTKADMARLVGKTEKTWANWENGQSRLPADVAMIIAEALKVDVDVVLQAVAR